MSFPYSRDLGSALNDHTSLVTELCVLRTFGGVNVSLTFICAQTVPEFLWDRLRASTQFPVMPKRAQYARFSGEGSAPSSHEGSFSPIVVP
eukprot:COSAG02_NODE_2216_length_9487_cov_916.793460_4_plen_91_part_00